MTRSSAVPTSAWPASIWSGSPAFHYAKGWNIPSRTSTGCWFTTAAWCRFNKGGIMTPDDIAKASRLLRILDALENQYGKIERAQDFYVSSVEVEIEWTSSVFAEIKSVLIHDTLSRIASTKAELASLGVELPAKSVDALDALMADAQ